MLFSFLFCLFSYSGVCSERSNGWIPPFKSASIAVNMLKEWDESVSPTHRMWSFCLHWNFFSKKHDVIKGKPWSRYILYCTKTSKKGRKTPNGDFYLKKQNVFLFNKSSISNLEGLGKPLLEHSWKDDSQFCIIYSTQHLLCPSKPFLRVK